MTYEFGDKFYFISPYDQYKQHNNKECMVLKTTRIPVFKSSDVSIVIPIQMVDGYEKLEAHPEELHTSNWFYHNLKQPA